MGCEKRMKSWRNSLRFPSFLSAKWIPTLIWDPVLLRFVFVVRGLANRVSSISNKCYQTLDDLMLAGSKGHDEKPKYFFELRRE
jgi:hypothetical protein